MLNHYALLKIAPGSDQTAIQSAFSSFRQQVSKYCPGIELGEEDIRKQFPEIWHAYSVLLDPDARKNYDAHLNALLPEPPAPEVIIEEEEAVPIRTRLGMIASYIGFGALLLAALYVLSQLFIL